VCLPEIGYGREGKEFDNAVNYDESKIPHYDLPPLLVTAEGKKVTTPDEWVNVRRPQILSLFSNMVYGGVPIPESPIRVEYEVQNVDETFMNGKATRKRMFIRLSNDRGKAEMMVVVFVPNQAAKHTWADSRGEYLSAYHASEVHRLLGKQGLTSKASPPLNDAILDGDVGYHVRAGGHSVELYDWQRFMDFADRHLKK
jgi:hypothetical protein